MHADLNSLFFEIVAVFCVYISDFCLLVINGSAFHEGRRLMWLTCMSTQCVVEIWDVCFFYEPLRPVTTFFFCGFAEIQKIWTFFFFFLNESNSQKVFTNGHDNQVLIKGAFYGWVEENYWFRSPAWDMAIISDRMITTLSHTLLVQGTMLLTGVNHRTLMNNWRNAALPCWA